MVGSCTRKSRVSLLTAMTILVAGVASCYPGEISSIDEADLVLTFYDTTADFESNVTYAMPDTIIRIDDEGGSRAANPAIDAQILAQIEAEFTAIGYQRVAAGTPSDVVVLVTATRIDLDYWFTGGWWSYWGWWPGWGPGYGPGWAPLYPWGPSYGGTQSLGTLAITMLDPNSSSVEDQEIPATWVGAVNGLLIGSDASILARIEDLIDQAFVQSPYL